MLLKLQILSTDGAKWVGWCKNRLVALSSMRKSGQIFKKTYVLPDKIFAQIISSDFCDIIRIWGGGVTGIICHPRSQNEVDTYVIPAGLYGQLAMDVTAIKGGWAADEDDNFAELTTRYAYPLVDADNASFLLSGGTAVDTGEFLDKEGNYGNIYWHNNDVNNLSIISYKGTPTRHFPLTQQGAVTGADFATDGQGYTIYKGGVALTNTRNGADGNPEAICGAAELGGEVMCCTSSGVSIYQGEEWVNIPIAGWIPGSTWFFDSTGKNAINSSGSHTLTFVKADDGTITGTQSVSYIPLPGLMHFGVTQTAQKTTYDYAAPELIEKSCFELKATGETSNLSATGFLSIKSEYFRSSDVRYADIVVYNDGSIYAVSLAYDGIETVCAILLKNGLPASPPGLACGPLTYSFSNANQIGNSACAIVDPSILCCHDASVITVGVNIAGPGVSASGSIDITTIAKAGSWVLTAVNFSWVSWLNNPDGGACSCNTYTDTTPNDFYVANGIPGTFNPYGDLVYSACGSSRSQAYTRSASTQYVNKSADHPVVHEACLPDRTFVLLGEITGGDCHHEVAGPDDPCGFSEGAHYYTYCADVYGDAVQLLGTATWTWVCS